MNKVKLVSIPMLAALLISGCAAKAKLYRITPVVTLADSIECFKKNGKGALIADLAPDGSIASGFVAGCIVGVK